MATETELRQIFEPDFDVERISSPARISRYKISKYEAKTNKHFVRVITPFWLQQLSVDMLYEMRDWAYEQLNKED